MRKILYLACVAAFAAGCSSNPDANADLKQLFSGPQIPEPTAEFIALAEAEAPAYVLSIEEQEQAFATILRQTVNSKGEETWITGDARTVSMKQGMIIATRGFGGDILAGDASKTLAYLKAGREGVTERFITHLTGNNEAKTLSFKCRITNRTRQPLDLGGRSVNTRVMSELCTNGSISFENFFWIEQGRNRIVQSRQWISESIGTFAMRIIPR